MTDARENLKNVLLKVMAIYGIQSDEASYELIKRVMRDKREPKRGEKHDLEEQLTAVFQQRFKRQLRKLKERLSQYNPDSKAIRPPTDDIFMDNDEEIPEIIKILFKSMLGGVQLFAESLTFDFDWTLVNSRALEAARKYTFELVRGIDETSRGIIGQAIQGFVETPGMTIGDVIENLLAAGFDEKRAERIGVTEITRAYAQGEMDAGKALKDDLGDVRVTKTWNTNMDDITCEICMQNENEEVEIDEPFPSGDDKPPAHVNCRCWISTRTRINAS